MFRRRSKLSISKVEKEGLAGAATASFSTAFTLLEVMLAVAIIGLVGLSIFRFVESTLRVVGAINQGGGNLEETEALCRMLQYQLNDLPITEQGAILGQAHMFNGIAADELQWVCGSGNGLFTAYAAGDYRVTLMVKSDPKTNTSELGLRRVLLKGNPEEFNWVPLVPGIKAMESRFFDARLNTWVEKWTDLQARPNLLRLKLWDEQGGDPYEVVLSLPKVMLPGARGGLAAPPQNPAPGLQRP